MGKLVLHLVQKDPFKKAKNAYNVLQTVRNALMNKIAVNAKHPTSSILENV